MKENTAKFTNWTGFRYDGGHDLTANEIIQACVIECSRRYFGIKDPEKVQGWVDFGVDTLHIAYYCNDELIRAVDVENGYCGQVHVHLKSREDLKVDPVQALKESWLQALGFPADYPCSDETKISQGGMLQIDICPCF